MNDPKNNEDRLIDYLFGELRADEKMQIEAAMDQDLQLRQASNRLKDAADAIGEAGSAIPSVDFDGRLWQKLAAETKAVGAHQPNPRLVPEASYGSAESAQRGALQDPHRRRTWSLVMKAIKRKGSVYATAAVFVVGIVVGLVVLNKSASITLADVQAAVAGQTWVHVRYDNGREEWTNLQNGRSFLREVGGTREGQTFFVDPAAGIRMIYWPVSGEHIQKDHITPWTTPRTPWDLVFGTYEQQARANGANPDLQEEIVDGRRLVRLDMFVIDALGQHIVAEQIWADPATLLPVRVKRKLDLAARQEQNREYITGEYEFPTSGPSRLEDVGVPPNLPVVEADQPAPQDVQQIIDAGAAAKKRFPTRYRVIRYQRSLTIGERSAGSFNSSNIILFWRDGDRFRLDNYTNLSFSKDDDPQHAKYHLDLPATVEQILAWTSSQEDVHDISIDASGKSYSRMNPHPAFSNTPKQPEARVTDSIVVHSPDREVMLVNGPNWPHNQPWPYVGGKSGGWQILPQSEDLTPGCVGLRYEAGDIRRDCIIDPAHDYICVNHIHWKQKDGQWIKDRQDQLLDFQQLPTGQWYPMQWKVVSWTFGFGSSPKQCETVLQDTISLPQESDLPADLFDGQKLLEGAKVETY